MADLRKLSTVIDTVSDIVLVEGQVSQDHVSTAEVVKFGGHLDLIGHDCYRIVVVRMEKRHCINTWARRLLGLVASRVVGFIRRIHGLNPRPSLLSEALSLVERVVGRIHALSVGLTRGRSDSRVENCRLVGSWRGCEGTDRNNSVWKTGQDCAKLSDEKMGLMDLRNCFEGRVLHTCNQSCESCLAVSKGVAGRTTREGCLCQNTLQVYSMLLRADTAWELAVGGVTSSVKAVQVWSTENNVLGECLHGCLSGLMNAQKRGYYLR